MRRPRRPLSSSALNGTVPLLSSALEATLWTVSLGCLAAALWMLGDAWWFQARATRHWRGDLAARSAAQSSLAVPGIRAIPEGTLLGRLSIPRLDLAVVIAEGTSTEVLGHAVGHLPASPKPGSAGNVVLAGHRDTFFRPLELIRLGDWIELDDGARVHRYRVEWVEVVDPDRLDIAAPSQEPALTLITCYPFHLLGPAPRRFVVHAREQRREEDRGALTGG